MANLESVLKSRDIILPPKVHLVKAMVFPVVMYECESWTIRKAEHWRIDAFELWCWKRLLRFPWTARRSNQSILKEISPEHSLEGLMLKLKLQYLGHLMWRTESLEKTDAGKDWRQEEKGMTEDEMVGWHHQLNGVWWWTGKPGVLQSTGLQRVGHDEWQNWTELREHFPWEKGPGCTILIPTDPGRLLRGNESSWQCREHRRRGLDLGGEDPREKEMATHFSILACEIPWTEEPGKLQSMDLQMSWTEYSDWVSTHRQGQRTEGNTGSWNTSPSVQLQMRIS